MRTAQSGTQDEPRHARWRLPGRLGRREVTTALAVTAALLLAASLSIAPAGAAVTAIAHTPPAAAAAPLALTSCLTGESNSYEFYTWCKGTSPTSFRTIALCANGNAVLGVEYADGSGQLSYDDCTLNGQNSTLNADWGTLLCSNSNGAGTYQGYDDRSGDISWILLNWGNGNITTGGTTLCDYSTSVAAVINPNVAPT